MRSYKNASPPAFQKKTTIHQDAEKQKNSLSKHSLSIRSEGVQNRESSLKEQCSPPHVYWARSPG